MQFNSFFLVEQGAEGVSIDRNQLTRVDGNGIFLGGYTRRVNITGNDMNWIGDSPMAAFGYTSEYGIGLCLAVTMRLSRIPIFAWLTSVTNLK